MDGCPDSKLILELINEERNEHFNTPARCKKWGCPYCGPINSRNLGQLLAGVIADYQAENRLSGAKIRYTLKSVTLTCLGDDFRSTHDGKVTGKLMKKALNRLLAALRYHYGLEEYFWVVEYVDGYPHIHLLLIGSGISGKGVMRFINDKWLCLGMGRSEVKLVRSPGGVCHYFTKYISKSGSKSSVDGAHTWEMSKKLRSRVKETRELSSMQYTVVKVFRRNDDGSVGRLIWEVGGLVTLPAALEAERLEELSAYFQDKIIFKGKQAALWDDSMSWPAAGGDAIEEFEKSAEVGAGLCL